jgi:hypothetical protein
MIKTSRTEALVGFIKQTKEVLPHMHVDILNDFSSIILNSTNQNPIAETHELLLTATSKFELTHMKYNQEHTELLNWGEKPSLIEPVTGTIFLDGLEGVIQANVSAINGEGKVMDIQYLKPDQKGIITIHVGKLITPVYLIEIIR